MTEGKSAAPRPGPRKFCPSCGGPVSEETVGAFVEIGEWDGRSHESEGDARGWRCDACGAEFWTDGPTIPKGKPTD